MPGWNWLKNEANAKHYLETELSIFENYSHSSSKNNRTYSRKRTSASVFIKLYN